MSSTLPGGSRPLSPEVSALHYAPTRPASRQTSNFGVLSVHPGPFLCSNCQHLCLSMEMPSSGASGHSVITGPYHSPCLGRTFGSPDALSTHFTSSVSPMTGAHMSEEARVQLDACISKLQLLFPATNIDHIKELLKKYHYRENLVISALQVEKQPLATPGPSVRTPPIIQKGLIQIADSSFYQPSSGAASPYPGFNTFPKPHSSPKMKLRYLKSVFPIVEETLLLEVLGNCDNNVQTASEKLLTLGFEKRDTPPPKLSSRFQQTLTPHEKTEIPAPKIVHPSDKKKIMENVRGIFRDVSMNVINMALDSAGYNEDKTCQILKDMQDQEENRKKKLLPDSTASQDMGSPKKVAPTSSPYGSPRHKAVIARVNVAGATDILEAEDQSSPRPRRSRIQKNLVGVSHGTSTSEDQFYRSKFLIEARGPDRSLHQGPSEKNLLKTYLTWQGPNLELRQGCKSTLAKGPNVTYRGARVGLAKGPNRALCKGPASSLALGSAYKVTVLESRVINYEE